MDSSMKLIFRYDNTGHHKKSVLPTYPHHKHLGHDDNVVPSDPMDLAKVLREIEAIVELPCPHEGVGSCFKKFSVMRSPSA